MQIYKTRGYFKKNTKLKCFKTQYFRWETMTLLFIVSGSKIFLKSNQFFIEMQKARLLLFFPRTHTHKENQLVGSHDCIHEIIHTKSWK